MSEQLQHKMQTFEVAPPAQVWQAISVQLDDDIQHAALSKKLFNYEITPPVIAWKNIVNLLDNNNTELLNNNSDAVYSIPDAKVRSISSSKNWYKMAAAAAITALLLGAGWYVATQNNKETQIAIVKDNNPLPEKIKETVPEKTNNQPQTEDIAVTPLPKVEDVIVAQNAEKSVSEEKAINNNYKKQNEDFVVTYSKINSRPAYSYLEQPIVINAPVLLDENGKPYRDINAISNANRYLAIAGPNGQMTRISAKFANVIQFIDGSDNVEENLDKILRESGMWKIRFQQWREKIKKAGYLPAPGNFLDILEFKELIEEK
jgi:hypothetical protein